MSPVVTSTSPELLEHPAQAFDAFRADGVEHVVCEEKHMGSRAVALVCRSDEVARTRFGAAPGETGAVWTRTGRAFFSDALTRQLVDRLRVAAESAGLFDELDTPWLLLDAELMPWSAKAGQLLRDQYAAVGAAARASLPVAVEVLGQAAAAGLDVVELRERTRRRDVNAAAFTDAYRRYCWPIDGLTGVRLAPFQVLATEGTVYHDRPHAWISMWRIDSSPRTASWWPRLVGCSSTPPTRTRSRPGPTGGRT
jgi:protein phosphatase